MKYKFTPDGNLTPEKELSESNKEVIISASNTDASAKQEKIVTVTSAIEEFANLTKPKVEVKNFDNDLETIANFFKKVKRLNSEIFYEMVASDEDVYDFIVKIQLVRLWLEFRDYIDEVYGERCVYLEWDYDFKKERIQVVSIRAYDKKNKLVEVDPKDVVLEIKWINTINIELAYAYDVYRWERDNMNMGSPR